MFSISATYCSVCNLRISVITFFITFVYYMIIGEGTSSSVIRRYTPNTSKVGTRPSGLIVLLRVLNIICRAISLSILGNSTTMIW
jgi:hypothetical protein